MKAPYTERYVRCCERTGANHSLLLDLQNFFFSFNLIMNLNSGNKIGIIESAKAKANEYPEIKNKNMKMEDILKELE